MAEQRLKAVDEFGFTERQARFLVTVMLHGGVCVPRQYAAFCGIAHGHKVNVFFDKLVRLGFATVCDCRHNRGRLYHVHHTGLYRAIGEPHSRFRRSVPAGRAIERVMLLDGVVTNPELIWLGTEQEKVSFFAVTAPSIPGECVPHVTVGTGATRRVRMFPDKLPIGVQSSGQVVFFYLVTASIDDDFLFFRATSSRPPPSASWLDSTAALSAIPNRGHACVPGRRARGTNSVLRARHARRAQVVFRATRRRQATDEPGL